MFLLKQNPPWLYCLSISFKDRYLKTTSWHIKHMTFTSNKSTHRFFFEAASAVNKSDNCKSLSNFCCRINYADSSAQEHFSDHFKNFHCLAASSFWCLKLPLNFDFWKFELFFISNFTFWFLKFQFEFQFFEYEILGFLKFQNFFLNFKFQILRSSLYSPRVASPGRTRGAHSFFCCLNLLLASVLIFLLEIPLRHFLSGKLPWRHF